MFTPMVVAVQVVWLTKGYRKVSSPSATAGAVYVMTTAGSVRHGRIDGSGLPESPQQAHADPSRAEYREGRR